MEWVLGLIGLWALRKTAVETVTNSDPNWWTRFDSLFKKYGEIHGVDWTWLKAIALNESDLGREKSVARGLANPQDISGSKSSDGKSWGLMQVTLTTAKTMDPSATEEKLNNPEYSINLGARYVRKMLDRLSPLIVRRTEFAIKSYNQGPGNTDKEMRGEISGYAHEYWARFERNLERIKKG